MRHRSGLLRASNACPLETQSNPGIMVVSSVDYDPRKIDGRVNAGPEVKPGMRGVIFSIPQHLVC